MSASRATPDFLVPPEWAPPSGTRHDHGDGTHLHLDGTDKMHVDLCVDRGDSLESEVERLVALGATRVDWGYADGAQHVVLADPDGNLFCVCGERDGSETRRGHDRQAASSSVEVVRRSGWLCFRYSRTALLSVSSPKSWPETRSVGTR